jgi:hypothetical protein
MKFLAQRYREKMEFFFGKAGMNWHESVCTFVDETGNVCVKSMTHLCDSSTQDSQTVAAILGDVLATLKRKHKFLEMAFIQSDNAGCYHSFDFIIPSIIHGVNEGIKISKFVFSEAQDGKNSCDRILASKKGLISSFVDANKGNILRAKDIMSAFHAMKNERPLPTLQGLESCVVFEPISSFDLDVHHPTKIKVSRFSDFSITYDENVPLEIILQEQSGYGPEFRCSLNLQVEGDFRKVGCIWISKEHNEQLLNTKLPTESISGPLQQLRTYEPAGNKRRKKEPQKALTLNYGCSTPGCLKIHSRPVDPEQCNHRFRSLTMRDLVSLCVEKKMACVRSISANVTRTAATPAEISEIH